MGVKSIMNSIDIVLAIKALNNNAEIVVYGDDIDTCTIEWRAGAEISKADIKTKITSMTSEKTIINSRLLGYGDIGEQLDLLYKDIVADKLDTTGEWAKKIKAVKDANPKG
tara:strand:+ start:639 stop:971 length:333 start_codon:yes stop_codon:yes gene_type:complete